MSTTPTRRATHPHPCPHCRCDWDLADDMGFVDKDAPFFPLVELIDGTPNADPRNRTGTPGKWR